MSTPKSEAKKRQLEDTSASTKTEYGPAKKTPPTTTTTSASGDLTINLQILNLALEWLDPKDLAQTSRVCKRWQKGISQYTWKKSAENINLEACRALEEATGMNSCTIASGLVKNAQDVSSPEIQFPDPTLKPEDLFLLVEISAFGTKGAWCMSFGEELQRFDPSDYVNVDFEHALSKSSAIEFEIPPDQRGPLRQGETDAGARCVFDHMKLTASLWRADTGKTLSCSVKGSGSLLQQKLSKGWLFTCNQLKPVGRVAGHLCHLHEYGGLMSQFEIYLEPVLPVAGSKEEPEWLREERKPRTGDYFPSEFLGKGECNTGSRGY